ncbi:kinase-like domain-containing protein [Flagelloscypha sp. PMI_526]|nr:kinase-like domain-containing protein [Flagelloscypha sp. PMI_526]
MSKSGQCAKYQYVVTPAGPKILPVDEAPCKDEESPAEYNAGGYLPIHVSDAFSNGRYRVVRKLGWGHFSTVWLVKDTKANRHSALKVIKSAGRYAETARDEIKLLSQVSAASPFHPGRDHIVSFLDSFTHVGPESSHICIVFEPLGENLLSLIERNKKTGVPPTLVKVIAKQVLLGLQYLHDECDLVHTDIKPENILISIPDVEEHIYNELTHSPSPTSRRVGVPPPTKSRLGVSIPQNRGGPRRQVQIWESQPLSSPRRTVSPSNSTPSSSSSSISSTLTSSNTLSSSAINPIGVPVKGKPAKSKIADNELEDAPGSSWKDVIGSPGSWRNRISQHFPSSSPKLDLPPIDAPVPRLLPPISVKIADLGNATPSQKHFTEDIQTRQYRAPEAILGRKDWDTRADVWSVACVVFELLTAEYLFDPQGQTELFTKDDDHMAQIIELLGDFPVEVKMGGKYSRELFDHTGALRYIKTLKPWPLQEVMNQKYGWSEPDSALFCDFVRPMLTTDMRQRAHARDMVDHPWLEVDPSTLVGL